jgi:hypothetical protein
MIRVLVGLICILFGTATHAEEFRNTAVLAHAMCATEGREETIAQLAHRGKGDFVFKNCLKCLDEKLPAALAEAGKNNDLIAAIKAWHVRAVTWLRSPTDRAASRDEFSAMSNMEMEAKLAGLWH